MNHLQLAFVIGLFGSLHCVGMCGPLAFAIPQQSESKWITLFKKLSYNIGRAISYSFLGLLIGLLGKQLWLAGLQQGISILSGILIIVAVAPQIIKYRKSQNYVPNRFTQSVNKLIGKAIKNKAGHLYLGLLNGFLPCGFVYLGLATAINTSNAYQSALFMLVFGLGTTPLMLLAMLGVNFSKPTFRQKINQILPYVTLCLGLWFILRGLNLDIPYLSPKITGTNGVICH
ncbi:sulfite exporter TauE/SafE family protein [Pedobacter arcticus]|uniref:sulfite exporter TauE/SafE family protein n=1 Tax=Pedobacter arcticus TaxID=752140 RepID=UPI00036FBB36|nr:sulfite exporter TauE/SafE family protein [Pedobacter arcticus]